MSPFFALVFSALTRLYLFPAFLACAGVEKSAKARVPGHHRVPNHGVLIRLGFDTMRASEFNDV